MPLPLLAIGGIAAAGGLGSALSGSSATNQYNRNLNNAKNQIETVKSNIPGQSEKVLGMLNTMYSPYTQNAAGDMSAYRGAVDGIGGLSYGQANPFSYDLQQQTQNFLDDSIDYQVKTATDAIQGSAANRGNLFSSATGKAIADRSQEIGRQAWKEAMETALRDRGFQYDVYSDDIDRDRANVDLQLKQQGMKLDSLGNLAGMGMDATTNLANQTGNIKMSEYGALNDADLKLAEMMMGKQNSSFFGDFLSGAAGVIPGLIPSGGK